MDVEQQPAQRARDKGSTLVEILVAIVLTSVAVIPLMAASWVLVRNTALNRSNSKVETVLNNAADRVNRAPGSCDYTIYYEAAAQAQGWDHTLASATYQYYTPGATAAQAGTWTDGPCPNGTYTTGLVQLVNISVSSPDGQVHRSIQVVKSNV